MKPRPVHPDQTVLFAPTVLDEGDLAYVQRQCQQCTRCPLSFDRTQAVFGEGERHGPLIAFVGEAPGEHEDREGRPFVGPAGALLDSILRGMKVRREDVYLTNTVACRPPNNRKPHLDEIAACSDFLARQLRIVQPRCIVALGATAASTLLKTDKGVISLRGAWFTWEAVPLRVTHHPASLLHLSGQELDYAKADVWRDMKAVLALVR